MININNDFVKGMTLSIQYEAAKNSCVRVNESRREEHVGAGFISSTFRAPIVVIDRGWDWSSRTTTVINNFNGPAPLRETKEEKDEKEAGTAAVVGSFVAVGGAALASYTYSLYSTQKEALSKIENIAKVIRTSSDKTLPADVINNFTNLIGVQLDIDRLKVSKITNYFLASLGLLIGGVSLASGGFLMIPLLMTAGKITLLASAMGAAFNFGAHFNDRAKLAEYYEAILGDGNKVLGLADAILRELQATPCPPPSSSADLLAGATAPPVTEYHSLTPDNYASGGAVLPNDLPNNRRAGSSV